MPTSSPSNWPPNVVSPRSEAERRGGSLSEHPRFLNAGNAGPFTLDGTRTYLVGERRVVVIDPGPEGDAHVDALESALADTDEVRVVVTHGHRDHTPAAFSLAERLGVQVWGPRGLAAVDRSIVDGQVISTDRGDLVAVDTPGHARHHVAFHWPERRAAFVGDLLIGRGATTWVGEYPGCVTDYLSSLERIRALDLEVIYPAHGPAIEDPRPAIDRFDAHRRDRIRQVEEVLREKPDAADDEVLVAVYGESLPASMRDAALRSVRALIEHTGYPRS